MGRRAGCRGCVHDSRGDRNGGSFAVSGRNPILKGAQRGFRISGDTALSVTTGADRAASPEILLLRFAQSRMDWGRNYAFAAMFVTNAGFLSPITQLPWKMAPSSMISAGVSMSL